MMLSEFEFILQVLYIATTSLYTPIWFKVERPGVWLVDSPNGMVV